MCTASLRLFGLTLALLIAACGGMEQDQLASERGVRGGMGKADSTGSCKGFCGGQSANGCYCDDDCVNYGDCCSDKATECDGQVPPQPCNQLDELTCNGRSDCEWKTYPGFPGDISMCEEKSQSSCDPMDAGGVGMCEMFMGYKWNGTSCVGISGCSCTGADCDKLVLDKAACEQAHKQCLPPPPPPPPDCNSLNQQQCDLRSDCEWKTYPGFPGDISMCVEKTQPGPCDPMDASSYGPCMMFMGYKWNGTSCSGMSGCSCKGADCGKLFLDKASCEQAYAQCLPPPPPCNSLNQQQCNGRGDCEWKTYPGFPGDISICEEKQVKKCYVGGCSSEVCSEIEGVVTPCVYPPIGGLPPAGSVCTLKADGTCGWVVP